MHSFLLTFLLGIGILCSFAGWGTLVVRAVRLRLPTSMGFNAAVGLAFSVVVGGFLDGLHWISPGVNRGYLVAGFVLAVFFAARNLQSLREGFAAGRAFFRGRRFVAVLFVIFLLVTLLKYSTALSPGVFHPQDDWQGYMVFPVKMIQTGSIGADPFSERRIVSSLGGEAFLDTLPLSVTGNVKNLRLVDGGIGLLILLLLVAEIMIRKRIPGHWVVITLLTVSLYEMPVSNITSVYGGVLLLLLLFDYLDRAVTQPAANQAVFLAIVFTALMAMKTTFAPMAGIFFLSFFLFQLLRLPDKGKTFVRATCCGVLILILLTPWMIDSYHSSGTLFYPLFGRGYHGSRYGIYLLPTAHLGMHNLLAFLDGLANAVGLMLTAAICLVLFGRRRRSEHARLMQIVVILNLVIDVPFIGFNVGGVQTFRYAFAILFSSAIFLLIEELAVFAESSTVAPAVVSASSLSLPEGTAAVLMLGLLMGSAWDRFVTAERDYGFASLRFSLSGRNVVSDAELSAYRDMQNSIPPGQTVLVRLDKNCFLDFRRNTIYVDDLPSGSSLPPGIPSFQGPEPIAAYLLQHGIRYLAYQYGDDATFTRASFHDRLKPGVNVWLRRGAEIAFDFQDNIHLLGQSRKKIFDNGDIFVLDLASKAPSPGS